MYILFFLNSECVRLLNDCDESSKKNVFMYIFCQQLTLITAQSSRQWCISSNKEKSTQRDYKLSSLSIFLCVILLQPSISNTISCQTPNVFFHFIPPYSTSSLSFVCFSRTQVDAWCDHQSLLSMLRANLGWTWEKIDKCVYINRKWDGTQGILLYSLTKREIDACIMLRQWWMTCEFLESTYFLFVWFLFINFSGCC